MRLIDADLFEVVSLKDKSEDFTEGVEWMLEQIDAAPSTVTTEIENVKYNTFSVYTIKEKSITYFCADSDMFITFYKPNFFQKILLKMLGIEIQTSWW